MKRETPGTNRHQAATTIAAILTLLAATPAPALAAFPTDTPAITHEARPVASKVDETHARPHPPAQTNDPRITLTAERDTIIAGLEDLVLTLTREGALQDSLPVALNLAQEHEWVHPRPLAVTFAAGKAMAVDTIVLRGMAAANLQSGDAVVTVGSVAGYATDSATATVHVIALGGPAATVFVEEAAYTFAEDATEARATVVARMASGMPRGADVRFTVLAFDGSAVASLDFEQIFRSVTLSEESFVESNGRWEARRRIRLRLIDDDVREGTEHLRFFTGLGTGDSRGVVIGDSSGAPCPNCESRVEITDDEDIPKWELSVSPAEIREEEETSSTVTLAITNGKTFAADQTVTFAFAGTAIEGADYRVAPVDANDTIPGHQMVLPAGSTSLDVTVTALDDDIEDSPEEIEVSATQGSGAIGSTQTIRILNQETELPGITLTAERDTIIAGLEYLGLTLTRDEPLDDAMTVTVQLTQQQSWLSDTSYDLTFAAGDADAVLTLPANSFSSSVVQSGNLTVAVDSVDGYDTDEATATVFVISQEGPAVTVSLTHSSYVFEEEAHSTDVIVTARMAAGVPRGASFVVSVTSEGRTESRPELTAVGGVDYSPLAVMPLLEEEDFALEDGRWVARHRVAVTLLDDHVREGRERFRVHLQHAPALQRGEVRLLNPDTTACSAGDDCRYLVFIDDDEDTPALDLSVSADEINEEDGASSTATVAITNGKTFATDQVVTFAFAGTAIEGADYQVAPADGDDEASDHQTIMLADSNSVFVTLTAVDDDFEDGNETIEVSATHAGEAIGTTQTIRILNQDAVPKITLAASRDTIIAGLEAVVLRAEREAPFDSPITVTLQLAQEQDWLSRTSFQLNFAAGGRAASLSLSRVLFSSEVTASGNLVATVDPVSGYDTGDATATVHVVSQEGPAIKVSFDEASYRFAEDGEDPSVSVVTRAATGMPRGAALTFTVTSASGTAGSPGDYQAVSEAINVSEADFTLNGGLWQARHELPLTLVDDDAFEGTESFELLLERSPGLPSEVQLSDNQGAPCQDDCRTPVEITDDEDIPEWELSVSDDEIMEEGETSSTATVSITNGKTFAADRMVTFELGGHAIPGLDYRVTPADADAGAGHQVVLPAGSSAVEATFTALDDELEEPTEQIRIKVAHNGNVIGSETIRIIDRLPGPTVTITFEDVLSPRDRYSAGVATGPFTTRINFSEPVEGFTQEDISWATHSLTTVDTTNIGVKVWDYTVIREGLEYTARMMPDQNGRLWIEVDPGVATSVATDDGNQFGAENLWVELPPNRMMVEPGTLTVDEGDKDGEWFLVLLTSAPTDTVTVTVTGTDGTALSVDWPTVAFRLPYWNGGWGITVTARDDANTVDETVTLRVSASGGGYGGQTATVVVRVRDTGAGSAGDAERASAAMHLDGVTPEAAAAALLGEGNLSPVQLDALDHLGNRNGSYDLGDLLSWVEHCRRGEVNCGTTAPAVPALPFGIAALLSGRAFARRRVREMHAMSGSTGPIPRHGPGAFGRHTARPGSSQGLALWYTVVLLLGAALLWGCADGGDLVRPVSLEPDPGYLTVELTAPEGARDIGAMLVVDGPGIDSIEAPGFEMFQSAAPSPTQRQVIVRGELSSGPVLRFHVPDRRGQAKYRVRLMQVSAEDYLLCDLTDYRAVIRRQAP